MDVMRGNDFLGGNDLRLNIVEMKGSICGTYLAGRNLDKDVEYTMSEGNVRSRRD